MEEIFTASLWCEIVFEGLDPIVTDGLRKAPGSTEHFDEERALDQSDVTLHVQDVSVRCGVGTDVVRRRTVPAPYSNIFGKQ